MKDLISYNSWEDKVPFGALVVNQGMRIAVEVSENYNINNISWVILRENVELSKINLIRESKKYYEGEFNGFNEAGLYFYYFEVEYEHDGNTHKKYYGRNKEDGSSCEYDKSNINKYQITVYDEYEVPDWYKEGVLYHIFVDRFNNGSKIKKVTNPKQNSFLYGNWDDTPMYIKDSEGDIIRWDFHGGNLKGIIDKLGYLKKLGVSIIYLSPIFESCSNHKYDTGDYKKIDPMFGDEDIFKELIDKASKKGINIILDGVFSHTGADSKYFNKRGNYEEIGAYQSVDSKYRSWYRFKEGNEYNKDNDNAYNKDSISYDCWWGIKELPNVNELEPSFVDYIIKDKDSVINKWTNMGVKGWRLDVADELPPKFIKELKSELKNNDESTVLIGEVWEDASNKISYDNRREYLLGKELDSVMGYPFRNNVVSFIKGDISSTTLNNRFMTLKENYPKEAFKSNLNLIGTHDVSRIKTELSEDKESVKLAVCIQLMFEGVPYIYYGDEAGLSGGLDPDNRRTYPWKKEDSDMIDFYKSLITIRQKYTALTRGDSVFVDTFNKDVFGFMRVVNDDKFLILVNRSNESHQVRLDLEKVYELDLKGKFNEIDESLNQEDKFMYKLESKDFKIYIIK